MELVVGGLWWSRDKGWTSGWWVDRLRAATDAGEGGGWRRGEGGRWGDLGGVDVARGGDWPSNGPPRMVSSVPTATVTVAGALVGAVVVEAVVLRVAVEEGGGGVGEGERGVSGLDTTSEYGEVVVGECGRGSSEE